MSGSGVRLDLSNTESQIASACADFVRGRVRGLAVAWEATTKLKEVCVIHAESFSAAAIMIDPVALVSQQSVALASVFNDTTRQVVLNVAKMLNVSGTTVLCIGENVDGNHGLSCASAPHPDLTLISQIVSSFRLV